MKHWLGVCSLVLVTAGCASNPAFDKYQDAFTSEASLRGITVHKVRIRFGHPERTPLSSTNLGMYYPGSPVFPGHVEIDRQLWLRMSETEREILVFHELGHSIGKAHCSHGVMLPVLMNATQYRQSRKKYLDELFQEQREGSPDAFSELSAVEVSR